MVRPHRPTQGSWIRLAGAACLAAVLVLPVLPQGLGVSVAQTASPIGLNRWSGSEGGQACLGGDNCAPFFQSGLVYGASSGTTRRDPDGIERSWPARTGRRFAMPAILDGSPGSTFGGYLTSGTPFPGGTVSFAMRIHTRPVQPLVFYEHRGSDLQETGLALTLLPNGQISASHRGVSLGITPGRLQTQRWHVIGMSYGPSSTTFKLSLDRSPQIVTSFLTSRPAGHVEVGIVYPVSFPYHFGLDDYVEATMVDAPILGARVGYLIPHGAGARTEWSRMSTDEPGLQSCFDAAANWQMVSEDQSVQGAERECWVDGWGVRSSQPDAVDEYTTEGIPSIHQPSSTYERVRAEPRAGEAILAVRPTVRIDAPFRVRISIVDGAGAVTDELSWPYPTSHPHRWIPAGLIGHTARWTGEPWTAQTLGAASIRLQHGGSAGELLRAYNVSLEYVWVPFFL